MTIPHDCPLCPRLVAYRAENMLQNPAWHNAPVATLGHDDARALIVGLAPGRTGGNRTGRIFTGDEAGRQLFAALIATGFASCAYNNDARDDLSLRDVVITNAVACAPPGNRPTPAEQAACRPYLATLIHSLKRLKVIVTLGDVARANTLRALGLKPTHMPGGHGQSLQVGPYRLINSYHCSQLNMNTGRLTPEGLRDIFILAREFIS